MTILVVGVSKFPVGFDKKGHGWKDMSEIGCISINLWDSLEDIRGREEGPSHGTTIGYSAGIGDFSKALFDCVHQRDLEPTNWRQQPDDVWVGYDENCLPWPSEEKLVHLRWQVMVTGAAVWHLTHTMFKIRPKGG